MPAPRPVKYTPAPQRTPPRRPAYTAAPKCGTTCHVQEKQQARLALGCCFAVIVFVTAVCVYWPHHHTPGMPWAPPASTGPAQIYPHSPGMGAAVMGGMAKGAGHVIGRVGGIGVRVGIMRGLGRGGVYIPGTGGFHGYGLGIFGGF